MVITKGRFEIVGAPSMWTAILSLCDRPLLESGLFRRPAFFVVDLKELGLGKPKERVDVLISGLQRKDDLANEWSFEGHLDKTGEPIRVEGEFSVLDRKGWIEIGDLEKVSETCQQHDGTDVQLCFWWGQVRFRKGDTHRISYPFFVEALCKCTAEKLILRAFEKRHPGGVFESMYDSIQGETGPYKAEISN